MDESSKTFAPEISPAGSKKWIGRLIIAVVLGAAIWNFVVSLTSAVVLPGLARVMETDPQSPLYLGKGDFNIPVLFASILELCFAALAALLVSSWSQRRPAVARRKAPAAAPAANLSFSAPAAPRAPASPVAAAVAATPAPVAAPQQQASSAAAPKIPVAQAPPAPKPAEPAKPAKPKPPKEVYYNLVGEPVEPDDE